MMMVLEEGKLIRDIATVIDPEPFGDYDYPLSQNQAVKRQNKALAQAEEILELIRKSEVKL